MRTGLAVVIAGLAVLAGAQSVKDRYVKYEYNVPMRDGARLYVSVYVPKDKPGDHPILLERTPYGAGPYGPEAYKGGFGGSKKFADAGYIFAFTDVRGIHMSEGVFEDVRPQLQVVTKPSDVDESTDSYDTIDYLVKHVPHNNGRVGTWGISYPGGYAALSAINSHPALRAASPQAPVSEWFIGDDMHHHGAFFLQDCFSFFSGMGAPKNNPAPNWPPVFRFNINNDAYKFFLDLGPIANANKEPYFAGKSKFWNDATTHPDYDDFWQARNVEHNMKGVKCSVLTVGGWFDAEDLYGALHIYDSTEKQNKTWNSLVMGPWSHGGWASRNFTQLGDVTFGSNTSQWFQDNVEFPFFDACLRGDGKPKLPEATVFETGRNVWRQFPSWPPKGTRPTNYYFADNKALSSAPDTRPGSFDQYVSDPMNPVPYEGGTLRGRSRTYMLADQRFAESRPDVLTYRSTVLESDVTWAGPVVADLWTTISTTDADFVVKVIDVWPDGSKNGAGKDMSGFEQLVRGDIMRGKYRRSYQNPQPFVPGSAEQVKFALPDVFHTFLKGHRIMVQVQSSWFPLADRNPQTFCDIYHCDQSAFKTANVQIWRGLSHGSHIEVGVVGPTK
ncbi:MAG: CocE/NonD family hydrolase [Armatimonadetes bacterium]|nr:CocE/NonD family hydrolase [Armatimonadota bacterium]